MGSSYLADLEANLAALPDEERIEVIREAQARTRGMPWVPNPGPQTQAFESDADELFFGGEPGGGKTDVLIGTALNHHRQALLLRRLNAEVEGLIDRTAQILGHTRGLKRSAPASWRLPNQIIRFGGVQHITDREKFQGVPKDFIGFDELPNFLEEMYTFIIAWARSTTRGQRVRVIATGNPPTKAEGMWVIRRWGAWLDPNHPNPALPGELRWYTTIGERDVDVGGPGPVVIDGKPLLDDRGNAIHPKSRTFIPSALDDNPDLVEVGYGATLAGLPPKMRRAMMGGDFSVGQEDNRWQVFPTDWVEAAMLRWSEAGRAAPMTVLGVDIAQGGPDNTVLAPRHGSWFDHLKVIPGRETPDGPTVAGLVFAARRNGCEVILDMGGGYGGSTRDHLKQSFSPTLFVGAMKADGMRAKSGQKFANIRAAAAWFLRDALDPDHGAFIALPPDPELKAELTSILQKPETADIQIESKEDIIARIGHSPDRADALIMAHFARGKTNDSRFAMSTAPARAIVSDRSSTRRR